MCAIFVLHIHMCYQINANPGTLIEASVLSFGLKSRRRSPEANRREIITDTGDGESDQDRNKQKTHLEPY